MSEPEPLPKHPIRVRDEAAIAAYRAGGGDEHLAQLRQDGQPDLARALVMERTMRDAASAAPYTAQLETWLGA